jgi:HEAT repeat protein
VIRLAGLLLSLCLAGCGGDAREADPYRVTLDLGPMIHALAEDGPTLDRDAAVDRLAGFGPVALPAVDVALGREDATVRVALIEVLATMDAPAATTRLAAVAAHDPDDQVRAQAVLALGGMEAADAVQAVERALDDPNPTVSVTAAAACGTRCTSPAALERRVTLALASAPGPDALRIVGTLDQVLRGPDAEAAARLRALLRERVVPLLQPGTPNAARAVAAFLAVDVDQPAALAALSAVAGDPAQSATVRATALRTLGRVGGGESVPVVRAALDDRTLRLAALGAMQAMAGRGVEGAVPAAPAPHSP